MPATGPNVSSHAIAASAVTPVITVGCVEEPAERSRRRAAARRRARARRRRGARPCRSPAARSAGRPSCRARGPLPTLSAARRVDEPLRRTRRRPASWTRIRLAEMQVWPRVAELAEQRAGDRLVEVGVVEDDERRVAAELERDLLHLPRALRHQELPDLGRAGEAELADERARRQLARRSPARPRRCR